jgi:hypothetical protein
MELEVTTGAEDPTGAENSTDIKPKAHFTGKVLKVGLAGALIEIGTGKPGMIHI